MRNELLESHSPPAPPTAREESVPPDNVNHVVSGGTVEGRCKYCSKSSHVLLPNAHYLLTLFVLKNAKLSHNHKEAQQ